MRPGLGLSKSGAGRGASRCGRGLHFPGLLAAPAPCCAHRVAAAPPVTRGAPDVVARKSCEFVSEAAVGWRVMGDGACALSSSVHSHSLLVTSAGRTSTPCRRASCTSWGPRGGRRPGGEGARRLRPARKVERLADRARCLDRQGALEICLAHAARRWRHRDLRRGPVHR